MVTSVQGQTSIEFVFQMALRTRKRNPRNRLERAEYYLPIISPPRTCDGREGIETETERSATCAWEDCNVAERDQ